MHYEHIYFLTDDFGSKNPLDYRYDTLIEVAQHFHMDYNEELKRDLKENLCNKLKDLISEFEDKLEKLKHTLASVR